MKLRRLRACAPCTKLWEPGPRGWQTNFQIVLLTCPTFEVGREMSPKKKKNSKLKGYAGLQRQNVPSGCVEADSHAQKVMPLLVASCRQGGGEAWEDITFVFFALHKHCSQFLPKMQAVQFRNRNGNCNKCQCVSLFLQLLSYPP